jgi:hypothetical protein
VLSDAASQRATSSDNKDLHPFDNRPDVSAGALDGAINRRSRQAGAMAIILDQWHQSLSKVS